ncbi:GNAT family N-acetyltransferase [Chloroflexota bacterium]
MGNQGLDARRGLDKGAIAFCVFVERELAHIGWVALNEEAKNIFDPLPFRVDFSNREACIGGAWTDPKYRGRDLMSYIFLERFQFLRERGILILRCSVNKQNIASHRLHAKLGANMYAQARYLRVLRWQLWRERPLAATNP